jgi:ABC-type cobalt transport system substrate-binding protein
MKKYWISSAVVVVVLGTSLLLVFNKDKKEPASGDQTAGETSQMANRNLTDKAAIAANPKASEKPLPTAMSNDGKQDENQEDLINDIKKIYKPYLEKVNETAEKRLEQLILEAKKEYQAKKDRNMDVSRLEGKYLAIYHDYEESTKLQLEGVISNMQKEVIEKNLNENIGDEYFEMYQVQKEKRIEKVVSELKKLS